MSQDCLTVSVNLTTFNSKNIPVASIFRPAVARLLPLTAGAIAFPPKGRRKRTVVIAVKKDDGWFVGVERVAAGRGRVSNTPKRRIEACRQRPANHADQIVGRSCQRGLTVTRPRPRRAEGMPLYANEEGWLKAGRSRGSLGIDSQI